MTPYFSEIQYAPVLQNSLEQAPEHWGRQDEYGAPG